jgi:uncharacterized protein DUF4398
MKGNNRAVLRWIAGPLLGGALGISACTAASPPVLSPPSVEKTVGQTSPYALTELQVAQEELDKARLALNAYEYERACHLAEQASTDAQVAEARAGTEDARFMARDVRLGSEALHAVATRLAASL